MILEFRKPLKDRQIELTHLSPPNSGAFRELNSGHLAAKEGVMPIDEMSTIQFKHLLLR